MNVSGYHHRHLINCGMSSSLFIQCQEVLIPWTFLFSSLSGACSLTGLNLSDCNLKAISDDISSLFSLELLDLSGNDFVCLPKSIIQLSKLKWVVLYNCTSLRSLPKLPLNIESIYAVGCVSLEMLPDQLKSRDSLEPSLFLHNCFKLADNQSCIDWFILGIKKSLKISLSLPLRNMRLLFKEVKCQSGLGTKAWGLK